MLVETNSYPWLQVAGGGLFRQETSPHDYSNVTQWVMMAIICARDLHTKTTHGHASTIFVG